MLRDRDRSVPKASPYATRAAGSRPSAGFAQGSGGPVLYLRIRESALVHALVFPGLASLRISRPLWFGVFVTELVVAVGAALRQFRGFRSGFALAGVVILLQQGIGFDGLLDVLAKFDAGQL